VSVELDLVKKCVVWRIASGFNVHCCRHLN
jgi:hypothetical protein